MQSRIIEIANDCRHLSAYRGFMLVHSTENTHQELGRVALDDIGALITNAYGLSYTNNILIALAERGIPFVLCSTNHKPVGMIWPIDGHHIQAHRFDAQIDCTLPTKKRLWAALVKAKLLQQAAVLIATGANSLPLIALAKQVRAGDPENLEAQGARIYWGLLFGSSFRRDLEADGLNSLLNYGYTVLRAATARAVVAAGLHPSIGLHHSRDSNAMRLVDDLMEPFRPIIDLTVWQIYKNATCCHVNAETKRLLVNCLYFNLETSAGKTPVFYCLQRLATSLAMVLTNKDKSLDLPKASIPIANT